MGQLSLDMVFSLFSIFIAAVALTLSYASYRNSQRTAIREATEAIYKEWWSEHMRELRRRFFQDYVPKYASQLANARLTQVDELITQDKGRTIELCHFFDRVGWLGAAGLIDIDFVISPMQHTIRRVWYATSPLIINERELNPVYHYGFEWLFKRSGQKRRHQADLIRAKFRRPRVVALSDVRRLRALIDRREQMFREELGNPQRPPSQPGGKGAG
jgi:hypothetical protein